MRIKIKASFKLKIAAYYTLIVLSTLIIFILSSVQLIEKSLYEELDNSLEAEVTWVRDILYEYKKNHYEDNSIRDDIARRSSLSPRKEFIEIYDYAGNVYFRSQNLENNKLRQSANTFEGPPQ